MNVQVIELSNPLWLQTLNQIRHDIYHLPEYVCLEARRTKTIPEAILIVDGEQVFFVPYLLRRCNDLFKQELISEDIFDIVSPYGYPGILLSEAAASNAEFLELAMKQLISVLSKKKVCSAFFRLHPILNQSLGRQAFFSNISNVNGETVSVNLTLSQAEIWQQTRSEHRTVINRCKRAGFKARIVPYEEYIDEFIILYKQTMERVQAKSMYYFDHKYFAELAKLNKKIHLCVLDLDDKVSCGGLFTECCGIVQYHLGGTKSEFLKSSPSKLMFDYMRFWAKERGNQYFHLGGGVGGAKDSLYNFKAGFSKQTHTFKTLRLIADEKIYRYLVELQAKFLNIATETLLTTDYFPAYRCFNLQ